nr:hypothetical protein [Tanacetum cinerariifolium]
MSAPEDDSFEIDDALAVDIVATSTLSRVSLTPALVENNKQMFPEVVKVLEQADPKALELTSMVAEDTHVHGTDMSMDSMVAIDTHVHGTDMSVDNMVAEDTHIHGTDMSVVGMVAEGTHVHGTRATLNNYDHTRMDMMVEDCI